MKMAGVPIPKFAVPNRDSNRVQNPQGETSAQHQERMNQVREVHRQRLEKLTGGPSQSVPDPLAIRTPRKTRVQR
jgi:hypothetical protein